MTKNSYTSRSYTPCPIIFLTTTMIIIKMIIISAVAFGDGVFGYNDLAFRKPTSQSSTLLSYISSHAVDSDKGTRMYLGKTCSSTEKIHSWDWWMVDLGMVYNIGAVRIFTRRDCCPTDFCNFKVEVTEQHPSVLPGFPEFTNQSVCVNRAGRFHVIFGDIPDYQCEQPVKGRYIRIVMNHKSVPLVICHFAAFEAKIGQKDAITDRPNLALHKPALLSSNATLRLGIVRQRGPNAVDGSKSGSASYEDCAISDATIKGLWIWLVIDLEDVYTVDTIFLTSEVYYYKNHFKNFTIELSMDDPTKKKSPKPTGSSVCFTRIEQVPPGYTSEYKCDKPVTGRYVGVFSYANDDNAKKNRIAVCEVEVYGKPYHQNPTTQEPTTQEPTTPKPTPTEAVKWRFELTTETSSGEILEENKSKRQMMNCCRQRLADKKNITIAPFVQIDLPSGVCRFLKLPEEGYRSLSSSWVIYKAEQFDYT